MAISIDAKRENNLFLVCARKIAASRKKLPRETIETSGKHKCLRYSTPRRARDVTSKLLQPFDRRS